MIVLRDKFFTFADKRALEEIQRLLKGGNRIPSGFLEKLSKDKGMQDSLELFFTRHNLMNLNRDRSTSKSLGKFEGFSKLLADIDVDKSVLKKLGFDETAKDYEHLLKKKYDPDLLERWVKIKLATPEGKRRLGEVSSEISKKFDNASQAYSKSAAAREAALADTKANPLYIDKKDAHEIFRKVFEKEKPAEFVKISKDEIAKGVHSHYAAGSPGHDAIGIRQDTHNELGSILHEGGHMQHFREVAKRIGREGDTDTAYHYLKNVFRVDNADRTKNEHLYKILKSNFQLNNEANASANALRNLRNAGADREKINHAINSLSPAYNSYFNSAQMKDLNNEASYLGNLIKKYNKK